VGAGGVAKECGKGLPAPEHIASVVQHEGARRSSAGRPRGEVGAQGPAKHAHWGGGMWPEGLGFLGSWHCG
jgi:hypothetical protein